VKGYEELRESAAWFSLSSRGKIRASGEDCSRFLHAMSTQDIKGLEQGNGLYAFFLNDRGHILADAFIYNLGNSFFLDTEPETGSKLLTHLDRYIIADDVTLEDATNQWEVIALEGPQAVQKAASLDIPVPPTQNAVAFWNTGFVARARSSAKDGIRLFLPPTAAPNLTERLAQSGIPQADGEAVRVVRIENGLPRYGEEITERNLVQETQQLHAVSFHKGCYLGQEIVERVRARGQVHRLLVPIAIKLATPPEQGTKLRYQQSDVGEIVSSVYSPALGEVAGLAYVRPEVARQRPVLTLSNSAAEAHIRNG